MRLPLIKKISEFIREYDSDYIIETVETLEFLTETEVLKDEEMDVIGELLSNMFGALEVKKMMDDGMEEKEALNTFMGRVMGSIDK